MQARQGHQVDLVALDDHLLARGVLHPLRWRGTQLAELAHGVAQARETVRQFGFQQVGDPGPDVVKVLDTERLGHPRLGTEHVDGQRHLRPSDILEEQGGAAGFDDPVDDLGDFQVRVDHRLDPDEVAVLLQAGEEVGQIGVGHPPSIPGLSSAVRRRGPHRPRCCPGSDQ
jgi:hypothetical protein